MKSKSVSTADWKCDDNYLKTEHRRVKQNVFKKLKHRTGFNSSSELANWWIKTMTAQNFSCAYCKTPIRLIKELIDCGYLKGRKTRGEGYRGPYLELERMNATTNEYSPSNCTLICYYCNNDKSNVYSSTEYMEFLAPAKNRHFLHLYNILLTAK